eukprot:1156355-Pelagomonas_calceolata.AAC.16
MGHGNHASFSTMMSLIKAVGHGSFEPNQASSGYRPQPECFRPAAPVDGYNDLEGKSSQCLTFINQGEHWLRSLYQLDT